MTVRGERFDEDLQASLDWLTSTDTWSRPVRVIEAPDGSVWFADMYRQVIEHPQWIPESWRKRLNVRAGERAGRIYRITKSGSGPTQSVDLTRQDSSDLLERFADAKAIRRDHISQVLLWREPRDWRDQLLSHVRKAPADVRLQAFGLLCAAGLDTESDWRNVLMGEDPRSVAWALRFAARGHDKSVDPVVAFAKANRAIDNELVAFESIFAFANSDSKAVDDRLRQLVQDNWSKAWCQEAVSVASPKKAPLLLREILRAVSSANPAELTSLWPRLQPSARALWTSCDQSTRTKLLYEYFSATNQSLSPAEWLLVLLTSSGSRKAFEGSGLEIELVRSVVEKGRSELTDIEAPVDVRVRAAQLFGCNLVSAAQQIEDLKTLLNVEQPGPVRRAALAVAYRVDSPQTADVLIETWNQLLPEERITAGTTLLQRMSWIRRLMDALESEQLDVRDLDASTVNGLRNCQNYSIMKRLGKLIAAPSAADRRELIQRYVIAIDDGATVSSDNAAKAYTTHCGVCHGKLDDKATDAFRVGPPLQNLKKWSTTQWVTAVLAPNANVEPKFKQYRVLTKSGQIYSGRALAQTERGIRLALSDGKLVEVERAEIDEMKDSGVSMMPEGLEQKADSRRAWRDHLAASTAIDRKRSLFDVSVA